MLQENLKKLRGKQTQEEVAKKLGISRARYSHYENGIREPDNELLQAIANLYEISVDSLLGRNENSSNINAKLLKGEKDIAKRLEQFKEELETSDGLAFDGEPMSDEAKESLLESMEYIFRQTQKINKKFTPKKYREND
ncbi:helix-turn-helix transcriptional regulator [Solibacillus sp. FSL R7-0682]|uniref:helix-turn-helix domain-containing protein n=1 Tax=Solibacillus sp. FSL R7-0682 TaxID=2921690 RepID=UPI0030F4D14B